MIFSVNTNHESVAYRSFSPSEFEARGARKVTTGIAFFIQSQAMVPASSSRPAAMAKSRAGGPAFFFAWVYTSVKPGTPTKMKVSGCSATQLDAGKPCQALGTKRGRP